MNTRSAINHLERCTRTGPHPTGGIPGQKTTHIVSNIPLPGHGPGKRLVPILLLVGVLSAGAQNRLLTDAPSSAARSISTSTNDTSLSELGLAPAPGDIWESGVGEGFRSKAQSLTVSAGGTYGIDCFGSRQQHHSTMGSLTYGRMLSGVVGKDHWYRGNWEGRLELFSGLQLHPAVDTDGWFVGLTPHLRYDFATGTHWVPFIDGGAGVTATGIGPPDLSGTFEFNLQAGSGVLWFIRNNLAPSFEARYVHWSCAGLHKPNPGLNGVTGLTGVTYFF